MAAESGYYAETNRPSYYPPDYPWSPTESQWVTYQSPDGTKLNFNWWYPGSGYILIENDSIGFQMTTSQGFTNPLEANFTNFTPLPWAYLKATGVSAPPLGPTNWASILGAGGNAGTTASFVQQAAKLNIGLDFQNGRWSPAQ